MKKSDWLVLNLTHPHFLELPLMTQIDFKGPPTSTQTLGSFPDRYALFITKIHETFYLYVMLEEAAGNVKALTLISNHLHPQAHCLQLFWRAGVLSYN